MPRLGMNDLPAAKPKYRITGLPAPPPNAMGKERQAFETRAFTANEDRNNRAPGCRNAVSPLFTPRAARRLAKKLSGARAPRTLASSRWFRKLRIRIIGAIWKLIIEGPWDATRAGQVAIISVAPRSWELTPEQLNLVRGEELLAGFAAG